MNHIIINIKNSAGGLNGRLDTVGKKLASWKIDWKKLEYHMESQIENLKLW